MATFFTDNYTVLALLGINAMLALSTQLALNCGIFSLAPVGFYGLGAYTSARLALSFDTPALLSVLAGAVVGVAGSLLLTPLLRRLHGIFFAMATVAFDLVLVVVEQNATPITGGTQGLYGIPTVISLGLMAAVVVVTCLILAGLERSQRGRAFRMLRYDEDAAYASGLNVTQMRVCVFLLSGAIGGAAGAMYPLAFSVMSPAEAGFPTVVLALTMVVVGGLRSWRGAVIGAFVVTLIPYYLSFLKDYQPVFYGVCLAVIATFVPGGIFGTFQAGIHLVSRKRSSTRALDPAEPASGPMHSLVGGPR